MLGSKLFLEFQNQKGFNVRGSARGKLSPIFKKHKDKIDARIEAINFEKINSILKLFKPDYIINCTGYIKQKILRRSDKKDIIFINSIFPHQLYKISKLTKSRLIHFSTDCVFDGSKGNYKECDTPNAKDIYGISKILGEVESPGSLTIRTSVVGHELSSKNGLLDWFLSQKNKCEGYSNAFFSGITTLEIFNFIYFYITNSLRIDGLIHLSSKKISKFDLLTKISKIYHKKIKIKKISSPKIDRSLNSRLIRKKISYKVPSWNAMINEMYLNNLI